MQKVSEILASSSVAFGTSGLRGLVEDITPAIIHSVTTGFLKVHSADASAEKKILLAHDLRPSSPNIASVVCRSLLANGYEPIFAGAVPTPAVALAARCKGLACIMVTGSHIPFDRNGIKFYTARGEASKADELAILDVEVSGERVEDDGNLPPIDETIEADYIARYVDIFSELLAGWRVGIYQHSAVGRDLSAKVFEQLGAEVITLGRSDEFVPIDTEAVSEDDSKQCKVWVEKYKLDAVFSTDGDGDRPLLADDAGAYFRGDVLGILTARFLGISSVATPVSSNTALEKSGWFKNIIRTKIGSPHVLAALEDLVKADPTSLVAGFEANGGFLTQTDINLSRGRLGALPTRDAILPALATMALARENDLRLSEVASLLPPRFTVSGRLQNRPTQFSLDYVAELATNKDAQNSLLGELAPVVETNVTDGLRMTNALNEIVHLRPSGNAPEFRIYVEAETAKRAQEILTVMTERLAKQLPSGMA